MRWRSAWCCSRSPDHRMVLYGGRQAEYLGGKISGKIPAVYAVGYLLAAFFGCLGAMETVWEVSDIFNGLMAVPNLAALVLLAREIYAPGEKRDP